KQLSLKDIWLDYFTTRQYLVSPLIAGEKLQLTETSCLNSKGQTILKFSYKFLREIEEYQSKGYVPNTAKVNFVLYWKKEEDGKEYQIVLPEIQFGKVQAMEIPG
ncbi:hypothetical protein, partial [Algoriphagus sp.]